MTYDLYYLIPEVSVFIFYYGFYAGTLFLRNNIYSTRYSKDELDFEMMVANVCYVLLNMTMANNYLESGFQIFNSYSLEALYFPFATILFVVSLINWKYCDKKCMTGGIKSNNEK
jgi:hypothetical protein